MDEARLDGLVTVHDLARQLPPITDLAADPFCCRTITLQTGDAAR
jgi:hypothetical protein